MATKYLMVLVLLGVIQVSYQQVIISGDRLNTIEDVVNNAVASIRDILSMLNSFEIDDFRLVSSEFLTGMLNNILEATSNIVDNLVITLQTLLPGTDLSDLPEEILSALESYIYQIQPAITFTLTEMGNTIEDVLSNPNDTDLSSLLNSTLTEIVAIIGNSLQKLNIEIDINAAI